MKGESFEIQKNIFDKKELNNFTKKIQIDVGEDPEISEFHYRKIEDHDLIDFTGNKGYRSLIETVLFDKSEIQFVKNGEKDEESIWFRPETDLK
mgnify:CR=1 FL=1